jgi:signal transduction histidine kinase
MKQQIGVRFITLPTILIGGLLFAITLAVAGFAFASYTNSLHKDEFVMLRSMQKTLERNPHVRTAPAAAKLMSAESLVPSLVILCSDGLTRVMASESPSSSPRHSGTTHIVIRSRTDISPIPLTRDLLGRSFVALSAAFGLHPERSHIDNLEITAHLNESFFVASMIPAVWILLLALLLAFAVSYIAGGILNRQALKPLLEVTRALERMSLGDFTLQVVPTTTAEHLGNLTTAYNGAVNQVQAAFAARDRANTGMRQFIADAGHQLRTPLTVIRGFITVLNDSDPQALSEREHCLRVMRQQSLIMGTLIDNLILLDRWEQPYKADELDPVDVSQLLTDMLDIQIEANPERRFHYCLAVPGSVLARIDPRELHFAIANIIDNAIKYTIGNIFIDIANTNATIDITIRDEGPGMAYNVAAVAFDRFGRGPRRDVEGSGLGLTIAKRAIERAGGNISLTTAENTGSAFHISLPLYSDVRNLN